jgi:hypothetical protein
MLVKFSMSSSTPETVVFAGIDAETSPPRVTSAMVLRLVAFYSCSDKTTEENGREGTHQPFFHCFISTIVHVLC